MAIDQPYRVGNHSPINIWRDSGQGRETNEQIAMAVSPEWAARIVAALNASAAPNQTAAEPMQIPQWELDLLNEQRDREVEQATPSSAKINQNLELPAVDSELRDQIAQSLHTLQCFDPAVDPGECPEPDGHWNAWVELADAAMTPVATALAARDADAHGSQIAQQATEANYREIHRRLADMLDAEADDGVHIPVLLERVAAELDLRFATRQQYAEERDAAVLELEALQANGEYTRGYETGRGTLRAETERMRAEFEKLNQQLADLKTDYTEDTARATVLDVARLLGTSVRSDGLDRDVIVKALRGLKRQDERLHNDIAAASQALAAVADRKVWEFPPSLKDRIELVSSELDRERQIKAEMLDTNRLAIQSLRGELDALKASRLFWLPEFGEDEEIPLGEPAVHNRADGRFVLRRPDTEATEQAEPLQCDAFGEGVCCRNPGHDGECDPGDDSPATPTEPRTWRRGDPEPPADIHVLIDRPLVPHGIPWAEATSVMGDAVLGRVVVDQSGGGVPADGVS